MCQLFIFTSLTTCKRSKDCLTLEGQRGSSSLSSLTTWSTAASVAVIGTSLWIKYNIFSVRPSDSNFKLFKPFSSNRIIFSTFWFEFGSRSLYSPRPIQPNHCKPIQSGSTNFGLISEITLIKKKSKFSGNIRKFKWDQLQSHIWGRAS